MSSSSRNMPSTLMQDFLDRQDNEEQLQRMLQQRPASQHDAIAQDDEREQRQRSYANWENDREMRRNEHDLFDHDSQINSDAEQQVRRLTHQIETTQISHAELQYESGEHTQALVPRTTPTANLEAEWRPVPPQTIDFGEDPNDFADPNYCFLCEYTALRSQSDNNSCVFFLLKFIKEQSHMMSEERWTFHAQKFYESHIMRYTKDRLPWMRKQIYEHFDKHAPTSTSMDENALKVLNSAMRILRDNTAFIENTQTGALALNERAINLWLKLEKHRSTIVNRLLVSQRNEVL